MKVTAILPDTLIKSVQKLSKGANITESLKIALHEWVAQQEMKALIAKIESTPLNLNKSNYTKIRDVNRKI